jgi:hypothetical protein
MRRVLWFRSISAAIIVICLYLLLVTVIAPRWSDAIINRLSGPLGMQGAVFASVALFALFPTLVTVGVFLAVDRYLRAKENGEFETRCRKCGHILRGITEPRCSECGERI